MFSGRDYNFSKISGFEKLTFEDAINLEHNRSKNWKNLIKKKIYSNPYAYIERGKYYSYIYKWE